MHDKLTSGAPLQALSATRVVARDLGYEIDGERVSIIAAYQRLKDLDDSYDPLTAEEKELRAQLAAALDGQVGMIGWCGGNSEGVVAVGVDVPTARAIAHNVTEWNRLRPMRVRSERLSRLGQLRAVRPLARGARARAPRSRRVTTARTSRGSPRPRRRKHRVARRRKGTA